MYVHVHVHVYIYAIYFAYRYFHDFGLDGEIRNGW